MQPGQEKDRSKAREAICGVGKPSSLSSTNKDYEGTHPYGLNPWCLTSSGGKYLLVMQVILEYTSAELGKGGLIICKMSNHLRLFMNITKNTHGIQLNLMHVARIQLIKRYQCRT